MASGIGILIVALSLLMMNWEWTWNTIKTVTGAVFGFLKAHWDKILLFLGPVGWLIFGLKQVAGSWGELWQGIKDTTFALVNPIIDIINGLIGVINKIPGVDIGTVGRLGGGAETAPIPDAHQGAMIRRGGLVNVLRGEAILSPRQTGQMFGMGGGRVINVVNHFHGLVVRADSDIDSIASRMRGSLEGVH